MPTETIINGAVKVLGLPDISCYTNIQEWAQDLANNMIVEIPADELTGVVVSVSQPDASSTDKLWIRRSSSGVIIGGYVYSGGNWTQLFPPPNQVFWMYGDSANPPDGYRFITQGDGTFTTAQYASLMTQAILAPNGIDYVYYPTLFTGI